MWRCAICETKNDEQSLTCVVCEYQKAFSVHQKAIAEKDRTVDLVSEPGLLQTSAQEQENKKHKREVRILLLLATLVLIQGFMFIYLYFSQRVANEDVDSILFFASVPTIVMGETSLHPVTDPDNPEMASVPRFFPSIRTYEGKLLAMASSVYQLQHNTEYSVGVEMAIDGNFATAWNEGAQGVGTGEWIDVWPEDNGQYTFDGFLIANGFQYHDYHKGDRYYKNNRVKRLSVWLDNNYVGAYEILDLYDGYQKVQFDESVSGYRFRFVIEAVYEGDTFTETCISEIDLF